MATQKPLEKKTTTDQDLGRDFASPSQEQTATLIPETMTPIPETSTQAPIETNTATAETATQEIQTPYPEQATTQVETSDDLNSTIDILKQKLRLSKKTKIIMPTIKDELTLRIEKVMEDGIKDAFIELTPIQKQEFKMKGEETAYKIRQLLRKTHIKIKDIFKLLLEWLKMLPGVNKFFLEQEAKIKADKILHLHDIHRGKK